MRMSGSRKAQSMDIRHIVAAADPGLQMSAVVMENVICTAVVPDP